MATHANLRLPALREVAPLWADDPQQESDETLVAGVLANDAACKERLYRRHVRYIAGMSARLMRSIDGAEDVVQDTFVIAFTKIESLRDRGAFRGWLAAIAISQVRRVLARQRLLRLIGLDRGLDEMPLHELARADSPVEARSELAALDGVLQRLPPRQRIAWMLRHVEGEPLDAVADACRCSRATVKRWVAAADARIRESVQLPPRDES